MKIWGYCFWVVRVLLVFGSWEGKFSKGEIGFGREYCWVRKMFKKCCSLWIRGSCVRGVF